MIKTEQFYRVDNKGEIVGGPFPRPKRYGKNTSDLRLEKDGVRRLWVVAPKRVREGDAIVPGETVFERGLIVRRDLVRAKTPVDLRQQHLGAIEAQIPDFTIKEYVRSSRLRAFIEAVGKVAEKKVEELESLPDDQLSDFSSELVAVTK